MKYRELTPNEIEAYDIGYKVGNRKIVITDIEWESENEHKIYRKGYMAGLMDYKRNVNNVSIVSKVNNVEIETPTTSITSTTPIGISISNGNKVKDKFNVNSIICVNGQYFDEFPPESISLLKKHWSADEIENMRKELTCKPDHQTTVAQLLLEYPPKPKTTKFVKPTVEEIKVYCQERKNSVDPDSFFNYYESKGWVVGKVPMKDWKAAVRTWEKNNFNHQQQPQKKNWSNYTGEGSFLKDAKDDPFLADIYNKKD